jgi:rhamnose transport system substrate-binding protein
MIAQRTIGRGARYLLRYVSIFALASLAGGVGLVSGASASPSASQSKVTVFMAPKFTGLDYFTVCDQGGLKAAKALGINYKYIGTTTATATAEVQTLEDAIAQHPSALEVSSIEADSVSPSLIQAMKDGIKVVTFDADADLNARNVFVNQESYTMLAASMLTVDLMNDPNGGEIAFMAGSPTEVNHMTEITDMESLIRTDPKYKKLTYDKTVFFDQDDPTTSYNTSVSILSTLPQIKFITSGDTIDTPEAARAIIALHKQGKVWAGGFALPSTIRQYIDDGVIKASTLWDPSLLGAVATDVSYELAIGEIKIPAGKVWPKAGTVVHTLYGTYTIGKQGELDVNKPLYFTKADISKYNF